MATWYEQFDTQIRIRRAVILHGSVLDDCWSPEPGYGRGMPLPEFVAKRLRAAGFEHVVRWDSVNGVRPEGDGAQRAFADDVAASVAPPQEGGPRALITTSEGRPVAVRRRRRWSPCERPRISSAFC